MFSLFIFGISPISGPVQSGPPSTHLNRNAHVQMALQQGLRWQTFQKDWGTGWGIRWDERNATPRFLYAPGTSIRNESALIVAIVELWGGSPEEWYPDEVHNRNDRQTSTWKRKHQGAVVTSARRARSPVQLRMNVRKMHHLVARLYLCP